MESRAGAASLDPAEVTEVAHETAAVLVGTGRAAREPELTRRLVALVDDLGLSTLAELWADRPARSLPGALWRLYALREWVQRNPGQASADYVAGIRFTDVPTSSPGSPSRPGPAGDAASWPTPSSRGVFDGDLAVALERAAAFCRGGRLRAGRPRARAATPQRARRARRRDPDPPRGLDAVDRRGPRGLRPAVAPGRPALTRTGCRSGPARGGNDVRRHCRGRGVTVSVRRAAVAPGPNIKPLRAATRREALPARRAHLPLRPVLAAAARERSHLGARSDSAPVAPPRTAGGVAPPSQPASRCRTASCAASARARRPGPLHPHP